MLTRYYRGESTLDEEAILKNLILDEKVESPESDAFSFYKSEAGIPDGFEEEIFKAIQNKEKRRIHIKRSLYSISSIAAMLVLVLSIYLNIRNKKTKELENNFFVMEQAMYQVSESIQPQEEEEMFVLWIDEDTPIIIN